MEKLDLCRICLIANVHHAINNTDLEIIYEKLTAMPFQTNDMRPLSVCYVCYAQLQDTKELILKCLTAETRLIEFMKQLAGTDEEADHKATLIDRLRLGSTLSVTVSSTDLNHKDGEVESKIKQELLNEQDDDMDDADDGSEMPVQYHPELLEARVSKLFNEKKITPSVNVDSKPDRQDNSNNIYHESIQLDITSITNQTLEQYQFEKKLEKLRETPRSVTNKTLDIVANIVCNRRLSNVKTLTDPSGCDGINMGDKLFTSNVCNKGFTTKPHLASHIRTHTGEKPFTCNVCNKSFARKDCLVRHTRMYTGVKPFTCNVCSKSLTTKKCLERHIMSHSDDKLFTSNICTKSYLTKQNLTKHIRTHGDRSFTCNVCNKSFITKPILKSHVLTHSDDRPFTCNLCAKSFRTKQHLAKHTRIHTGDKPFTCSVCNKSLSTKTSLVNHIRSHTGEKPFICDVCNRSFATKQTLIGHIGTHTSRQPFTCNSCNKTFIGKQQLRSHICWAIPNL